MSTFTATVMVPDYPPREKHVVIFNTFDSLQSGETMQIINDHDPKPFIINLWWSEQINLHGNILKKDQRHGKWQLVKNNQ